MFVKTNEASVMLYHKDDNSNNVQNKKGEPYVSTQANGIMQKTKTSK
jgi:hypothetical protein